MGAPARRGSPPPDARRRLGVGRWATCSRGCSRPWRPSSPAPPGAPRPRRWRRSGRCSDSRPGPTPERASPRRARAAHHAGAAERDMLLGVFSLADTTVAEVMTPRIDVIAVDSSADSRGSDRHAPELGARATPRLRRPPGRGGRRHLRQGHPRRGPRRMRRRGRRSSAPRRSCPRASRSTASCATSSVVRAIWRSWWTSSAGRPGLVTLEDILEQIVGRDPGRARHRRGRPDPGRRRGPAPGRGRRGAVRARGRPRSQLRPGGREHGRAAWCWQSSAGCRATGEAIDLDGYRLIVEQVIRRRVRRVAVYRPPVEAPLAAADRVLP